MITFGGGAERSVTAADGCTPIDHLFGSNLAITPGERLEDGLCIAPGADTRLFLRCQGVPEALAELRLTVTGEGPIYDGPLGNADWIYLGLFDAGSRQLLTLTLTVPENLSQEAAPGWRDLSWQLLAEPTDQPRRHRHGPRTGLPAAPPPVVGKSSKKRKIRLDIWTLFGYNPSCSSHGGIAQLVRAHASHA